MKSKTHIYMAQLLIDDLKRTRTLTLPGSAPIEPPGDVVDAILAFPAAFKAGAVGPDFYPDMLIGQSVIHGQDSGAWIELLFREYGRLPENYPDRKKCYAFILGFMMHYAGDMYGHYYVNTWSKGWFEWSTAPEKIKIIARHVLIETYMDKKVPASCDMTLDAPIPFLMDCFTSLNAKSKYTSALFKMPLDAMIGLESSIESCRSSNAAGIFDTLNYFPGWSSDIHRGTTEWFGAWHSIAHVFADASHSPMEAKTILSNWVDRNLALMLGVPGWAHAIMEAIQAIVNAINIFKPLKALIEQMIFNYISAFIFILTKRQVKDLNEALELVGQLLKDPGLYLNSGLLYPDYNITMILDLEMGNYGKVTDTTKQSFHAVLQCLNMGKLCLIGSQKLYTYLGKTIVNGPTEFERGVRHLKIKIKTKKNNYNPFSSEPSTCGTDDNVYLAIILHTGEVYETLLDTPFHNDFENNEVDNFVFNLPVTVPLNMIASFRFRKDYIAVSDDWKPEWMEWYDEGDNKIFSITINRMLTGRTSYTYPVSIVSHPTQVSIDHTIISFLYSLDGRNVSAENPTPYLQWERFPLYKDPLLKEKYAALFEKAYTSDDDGVVDKSGYVFKTINGNKLSVKNNTAKEVPARFDAFVANSKHGDRIKFGEPVSLQTANGGYVAGENGTNLLVSNKTTSPVEQFVAAQAVANGHIPMGIVGEYVKPGDTISLRTPNGRFVSTHSLDGLGTLVAKPKATPEEFFKVESQIVKIKSALSGAKSEISKLTGWAGFNYDQNQRIFYSRVDAWQQNAGYFDLYDIASPMAGMLIHCEPIRFEFEGKNWKIEFWKGQYGICTGAEIGIYNGTFPLTGNVTIDHRISQIKDRNDTNCASGNDMLRMSFELWKNNKMVFSRDSDIPGTPGYEKHWWLTGFRPLAFSMASDLTMKAVIVCKNVEMANAFARGLREVGYTANNFTQTGDTVKVTFSNPYTKQPLPLPI